MAPKLEPIVVIVGETASGKSDLAMDIALKFSGEIINADSWAVYRGFNIGTATPSKEDQKAVTHHLIDIADPEDGFNAALFKRLATEKIKEIRAKGKLPIISGGTGLYIDSLIYDYSFLPTGSDEDRKKYNSMSLIELKERVAKLKYDSSGIDLNNKRRVIRLLENHGVKPKSKPIRSDALILGLKLEPEKLANNIKKRVDKMLKNGLENEVKKLSKKYGWDIEPMKGIGYREFQKQFEGKQSLEQTKKLIIIHSLQLAKKQRTLV